jgi:hypothetical protein
MLACRTSWICEPDRRSMPQKIAACWAINSDAKVMPRTMPKYLPRLPVSIRMATQFMCVPLSSPRLPAWRFPRSVAAAFALLNARDAINLTGPALFLRRA